MSIFPISYHLHFYRSEKRRCNVWRPTKIFAQTECSVNKESVHTRRVFYSTRISQKHSFSFNPQITLKFFFFCRPEDLRHAIYLFASSVASFYEFITASRVEWVAQTFRSSHIYNFQFERLPQFTLIQSVYILIAISTSATSTPCWFLYLRNAHSITANVHLAYGDDCVKCFYLSAHV